MTDKIDLVHQNLSVAGLKNLKEKVLDPEKDKALKEACAGFEAIFMKEMIQSMRNTLPGDALFKESNATNIYKSMQDQHLAESLSSRQNSTGLKEFLYEQLKGSL
jgi:flagellar protein FlgJ